jgi:hypothetical protein
MKEIGFSTFESFKAWFDAKTKEHPSKRVFTDAKSGKLGRFYEDFALGKVPIGFLQEYAKQFYIFAQLTNAHLTWTFVNYIDLWRDHPELYDIAAAKIGEEFADPAPGGHGRTYLKYTRHLGLRDEELFVAKPIAEMESRINVTVGAYRASPAQTAVRWMLEGFAGYHLKFWRDTLHEKYNVPDEALLYYDIHVQADLEEHGPMGDFLLAKLYDLGMVSERDYDGMAVQVERAVGLASPELQLNWRDVLYERYCAAYGAGS